MKKKIIGIFVSMLLIATALPAVGTMNIEKADNMSLIPIIQTIAPVWTEDFDSYAAGSLLHGQGGWEAWDNNPQWTANVTDSQSRSPSNSVEVALWPTGWTDIVYQFYGVNSGKWNLTVWQYVPEDMERNSYFIEIA